MSEIQLDTKTPLLVRAYFVGQRLNLKDFEKTGSLAVSPLVIRAGSNGYAVMFRYGAAVLFGLDDLETQSFLAQIKEFTTAPYDTPTFEEIHIDVDSEAPESAKAHNFSIKKWDLERLQLIAEVVAKGAVLEHYESSITDIFDRIEPLATELQKGKVKSRWSKALLKHIGLVLSIERKMIAHVEIEGKPELLWDHPELETLHVKLEDEFEIPERHKGISHKLELIHRTADTMFSVLQERNTYHVEWYIVILIVLDIVINLIEKL
jgi:uncharacterized Rmd1/YagE family protein